MVTWELITEKLEIESEQSRLASMLENAPTNVLLADRDLKIIYVNPASLATLRKLERYLPVKPENVLGSMIDVFHKDPAYQRKILSNDKNLPVRANIKIGPETADLLVTAIYDKNKNYIGPMVTWELITEKLENERKIQEAAERERVQAEDLRTKVDGILDVVNAASRGDLTREIQVKGADSIGQMGEGLSKFLANLRQNVSSISEMAQTLASSSRQLTAVSQQMASNAEETAAQANVASAAAEQVSKNVTTVATGAEEMGASIKEIAKNANEAARVATSAVKVAEKTNATVAKLGESSAEIGNVIKVITSHRPADQPAGPERHHRGGPRRRGGQGLRRRRQRGQGAGQADRQGHRGHQPQDRGHPGRHQGRGRGHRPDRQDHQPDQRHPEHHRQRRRGADGHDRRDQPERRRGGQGQQRDRPEHHRRGPGRPQHHRGGEQHQGLGRRALEDGPGAPATGRPVQVLSSVGAPATLVTAGDRVDRRHESNKCRCPRRLKRLWQVRPPRQRTLAGVRAAAQRPWARTTPGAGWSSASARCTACRRRSASSSLSPGRTAPHPSRP